MGSIGVGAGYLPVNSLQTSDSLVLEAIRCRKRPDAVGEPLTPPRLDTKESGIAICLCFILAVSRTLLVVRQQYPTVYPVGFRTIATKSPINHLMLGDSCLPTSEVQAGEAVLSRSKSLIPIEHHPTGTLLTVTLS